MTQKLINESVGENKKSTKKMRQVEERLDAHLVDALPEMITANGMSATADELGVSKATLGYWCLKLDIVVKRVALAPGEYITIQRNPRERIRSSRR